MTFKHEISKFFLSRMFHSPRNPRSPDPQMIVSTYCARMDHGGCGLRVRVEDGKITRIEGDPDSPLSHGYLCPKGMAQLERMNHPDRLQHPLKRVGERGQGHWQRISWDEALETISQRIKGTIARDGRRAVVFGQGTPKGLELFLMLRLANLLNVPNVSTPGHVCHMPRETASHLTCGFFPVPDYDHPPACIVAWGSNLFQTNEEGLIGVRLRQALEKGAKLIVIDPRKTGLARRADLWLRPRPGSDLALALGVMRVILDEDRYDRDFVEKWTLGFEELKDHLQQYPLERVSDVSWVEKGQIIEGARLLAGTKPSSIQWGNAIEHNPNSFQCARALLILMAITGNLDLPGGNVNRVPPPLMRPGELVQVKKFPDKGEQILTPEFRLASAMGFVPSQMVVKTILTEKPNPIRMMHLHGTNPLLSYANAKETHEALNRLDFLSVAEIFPTPTALLADVVLPAATHFEFDDIGHYGLPHGFILCRPKIVEPPGECWPDLKILNELGKRLGYDPYFWKDTGACLDAVLAPSGMSYETFKRAGILKGNWVYRGYKERGFSTPSGKVELYSAQLKQLGYDPLPSYRELPESPYSTPELFEQFPLIFTSAKDPFFFHSSGRNLRSLRKHSAEPVVLLHPETASAMQIDDGTWVNIETRRGTIRQKARLAPDIDPRVVVLSYGWWFPERDDLELLGWKESNVNILTSSDPPYDPALGSTHLRGVPCRIRKSETEP